MKKENIISSTLLLLGLSVLAGCLTRSTHNKKQSIEDLTLQKPEDIKAWLDKYQIKNYTLEETSKGASTSWVVNVEGNVNLSNKKLSLIPVAFKNVSGNFNASHNRLTSLANAPQTVGGNFNCSYNKIESLEKGPQQVGQWYECDNNRLKSIKGAPRHITEGFNCSNNKLSDLKGGPTVVLGYYFCNHNSLTSLEGFPESHTLDRKAVFTIHNNKAKLEAFENYHQKDSNNFAIPLWVIIERNGFVKHNDILKKKTKTI